MLFHAEADNSDFNLPYLDREMDIEDFPNAEATNALFPMRTTSFSRKVDDQIEETSSADNSHSADDELMQTRIRSIPIPPSLRRLSRASSASISTSSPNFPHTSQSPHCTSSASRAKLSPMYIVTKFNSHRCRSLKYDEYSGADDSGAEKSSGDSAVALSRVSFRPAARRSFETQPNNRAVDASSNTSQSSASNDSTSLESQFSNGPPRPRVLPSEGTSPSAGIVSPRKQSQINEEAASLLTSFSTNSSSLTDSSPSSNRDRRSNESAAALMAMSPRHHSPLFFDDTQIDRLNRKSRNPLSAEEFARSTCASPSSSPRLQYNYFNESLSDRRLRKPVNNVPIQAPVSLSDLCSPPLSSSVTSIGVQRSLSDGDMSDFLRGFIDVRHRLIVAKKSCDVDIKAIIDDLNVVVENATAHPPIDDASPTSPSFDARETRDADKSENEALSQSLSTIALDDGSNLFSINSEFLASLKLLIDECHGILALDLIGLKTPGKCNQIIQNFLHLQLHWKPAWPCRPYLAKSLLAFSAAARLIQVLELDTKAFYNISLSHEQFQKSAMPPSKSSPPSSFNPSMKSSPLSKKLTSDSHIIFSTPQTPQDPVNSAPVSSVILMEWDKEGIIQYISASCFNVFG